MNISAFHDCANCGACYNACPTGAISVKDDGLFYEPAVNASLCVECGQCVRVCPVNNELTVSSALCTYSAVHKDRETVAKSSSGGAFSAIAQAVLDEGGAVFGAAFSDDCKTVLFTSSDDVGLNELRRSKYVESLVGDSFKAIKKLLSDGRKVLFCGTPCQVAGLRSYLSGDSPNLLTCDFVCGGLPSHQIYRDYIDTMEEKYHSRVEAVNFRPKAFGWREYAMKIRFENGRQYLKQACFDPYFSAFLHKRLSIRDYCAKCKFADTHQSDIILGDFWQYSKVMQTADDDTGISLITAITPKGKDAIEKLCNSMELTVVASDKTAYVFSRHGVANDYAQRRARYLKEFDLNGACAAGKKCCTLKGRKAVRASVRGLLKKKR